MNAKALSAFIAEKTKFDANLDRLQALSADHFAVAPDDVNWAHVGDVQHYNFLLDQIIDYAFNEPEF